VSEHDDETRRDYPGADPDPGRDGRPRDEHDGHADSAREVAFPADLAAVQADDAFLDALGGPHPRISPSDEALADVLLQWRREVDAQPIAELVDTDTAMALVAGARRPAPRRNPVLMPFAAAAALLVIAFSGVGLAAKSAEPGDRLWGVTQVLYQEHARSVEAANTIERELEAAETALQQGREADAAGLLDRAEQELGVVAEADGRSQLAERHDVLWSKLAGQPAKQDEPSGPAAGSSSSQPTSEPSEQQPPADGDERTEQSTAPSDEGTTTTEPEPSTATSTPMAETSDGGAQGSSARTDPSPNNATAPGGRSAPEPGGTESGTALGRGAAQPVPGTDPPTPTT
jgi:hypothetical protein